MSIAKCTGYLAAFAAILLAASMAAHASLKAQSREPDAGKSAPRIPGELNHELDTNLWPNSLMGGDPFEVVTRGDQSRPGRFDRDGNFIPEPFHEPFPASAGPLGGPFAFRSVGFGGPSGVGEHRSGRLILGTMVKGVFIPEIGSKVLDMKKDFDVTKPDRMVWNLWETVPAFWTEERKKQFPNGLPKDPEPPAAGVPSGWKLVPFREVYPGKPEPWHVRVIGKIAEFGHLDNHGEFIPDYGLPIVTRDGLVGSLNSKPDPTFPRLYYTLPYDGAWGRTQKVKEEVYEFRSGRLIKGTLHKTGNFVPEIGSKVIDFKDYDPLDRRRIYNLPGVLKKVK